MRRKRTEKQRMRDRADELCRSIVRARGLCARCGKSSGWRNNEPQWAHIIRRSRSNAVRCDPENAWCLCSGCHRIVDNDEIEWLALVEATLGLARVRELRARTCKDTLTFWRGEVERLTALQEERAAW